MIQKKNTDIVIAYHESTANTTFMHDTLAKHSMA